MVDPINPNSQIDPATGQQRSVVDELLYGVGQMGAGVIEFVGSSPEAQQEMPFGLGYAVPNSVWLLGSLAQQAYQGVENKITGNEPSDDMSAIQRYAMSGIENANETMSAATGQEIGNPSNLVDTMLREAGLFMLPTGKYTMMKETGSAIGNTLRGAGAVLMPGAQSTTKAGLALEYGAGVVAADAIEEYVDDEEMGDSQYPYTGVRDITRSVVQGESILQRDEYPVVRKPPSAEQVLAQAFPGYAADNADASPEQQAIQTLSGAFPDMELEATVLNGELQEIDDEPWLSQNLALTTAGILATALAGTAAVRGYGRARQKYMRESSKLFGQPDRIRHQKLNPKNLGSEETIGARTAVRETDTAFEKLKDNINMFRGQVHDYNHMLKVDNDFAYEQGRITAQRHEANLRRIDSIGKEGSIGEMAKDTGKSGIFPMSGIASRRSVAQIADEISLLKPDHEVMLNEHLIFRRILHEIDTENAIRKSNNDPLIKAWGDHTTGTDGDGWYSIALMKRMVNTPLPAHVKRIVDHYDDFTKSAARWAQEQGFMSDDHMKKWLDRPYAPLRYADQEPHATDFLRSQETIFDKRVQPKGLMKPTDMMVEYLNGLTVNVLHNRLRKEMLEMELMGQRKLADGSPAFRIVKNPKTDTADMAKAVQVYAHEGLYNPKTGKTHTGVVNVVVEDEVRRHLLKNTPMLHGRVINGLDTVRRTAQHLRTGRLSGLMSHYFPPISAAYEAITATLFHPKGYNTGAFGRAYSAAMNDKFAKWDAFIDPSTLANPVSGTIRSMYSDIMQYASRRLRTTLDMGDDMVGNVVGQTLSEGTAQKLTRPLDRKFVSMFGRDKAEALHRVIERAYLNSSKRIKEAYGGGTAPVFGDRMSDVPAMMHEISPSWSRNSGELRFLNNPIFKLWDTLGEGLHLSTRLEFIANNKNVAVQTARINGREIPVLHKPGVIGYSPDMEALLHQTRRLTGDITQHGGIPETTAGRVIDGSIKQIPYSNVAIQVLGRLLEQVRERPVQVLGALSAYGYGVQAYIANYILGDPEREQAYAREMGPTQRASGIYIFNDNNEIVGVYAIPHEVRLVVSPMIEGMLASMDMTGQTGNHQAMGVDLAKHAWKRFYQDVLPGVDFQVANAVFGAITGQSAPQLNTGRFGVSPPQRSENFEADQDEWMNRIRLFTDELMLGTNTMLMSSLEALNAARERDNAGIDWQRLGSDVESALTMNIRDERGLPAMLLFGTGNDARGPDGRPYTLERNISTYDDPAKIEWKNAMDKMKNWTTTFEKRMLQQGFFGGEQGLELPENRIRDMYGQAMRLGLMSPKEAQLGMYLALRFRKDSFIDGINAKLEAHDDQRSVAEKEHTDPLFRQQATNVIAMKEKMTYSQGIVHMRQIEKELRELSKKFPDKYPEFTTFAAMPNWPDTPWFDEEGVGKYQPEQGQLKAINEYESAPMQFPSLLPTP